MAIGTVTVTAVAQNKQVNLEVAANNMTHLITVERLKEDEAIGQGQIVRGSDDVAATGGLWRGIDFEAPQGVPLRYYATAEDTGDSSTGTGMTDMVGEVDYGGDYLMPVGRPELGVNVIIEYGGVGGLVRGVSQDVVPVINRPDPVVVQFGRHMFDGSFTLLTLEDADRRNLLNVFQFPSLMFVATEGYGFDDPVFVSPGAVTENRVTGLGAEPARRWNVDFIETARPPTTYAGTLPESTWQDRLNLGESWSAVLGGYPTWYDYAGYRLT